MTWNELCKELRTRVEVKGARLISFEGGHHGEADNRKPIQWDSNSRRSKEDIAVARSERNRWWQERYKRIADEARAKADNPNWCQDEQ